MGTGSRLTKRTSFSHNGLLNHVLLTAVDGKKLHRLKGDWMNSREKISNVLADSKISSLSWEVPK